LQCLKHIGFDADEVLHSFGLEVFRAWRISCHHKDSLSACCLKGLFRKCGIFFVRTADDNYVCLCSDGCIDAFGDACKTVIVLHLIAGHCEKIG